MHFKKNAVWVYSTAVWGTWVASWDQLWLLSYIFSFYQLLYHFFWILNCCIIFPWLERTRMNHSYLICWNRSGFLDCSYETVRYLVLQTVSQLRWKRHTPISISKILHPAMLLFLVSLKSRLIAPSVGPIFESKWLKIIYPLQLRTMLNFPASCFRRLIRFFMWGTNQSDLFFFFYLISIIFSTLINLMMAPKLIGEIWSSVNP